MAVLLVAVYHLLPRAIPGGYVGVDVFFAISGYLITGHLLRELEGTGRVALLEFWARRVRRLIPASLVVLAASVALILAWFPESTWEQLAGEVRAAACYALNWHLAGEAVAYLAEDRVPSPIEHFWSLSIEEQFYLIWPLWLVLLYRVGSASSARRRLFLGTAAVSLASFAFGLYLTARRPEVAYFSTFVRFWEFAAGGLLALSSDGLRPERPSSALRDGLGWLGLAAVVTSALLFDAKSAFPGVLATVPVLGTLAILRRGSRGRGPERLLSFSPLQWLGDRSYSFYLWHMPLGRLAATVAPEGQELLGSLLSLALSLALADLTKRWIEDPFRFGALSARPARASFVFLALSVVLIALPSTWLLTPRDDALPIASPTSPTADPCFGARARQRDGSLCESPALAGVLLPRPEKAKKDRGWARCMVERFDDTVRFCETGVPRERATATWLLIGDSHAEHWLPALNEFAERRKLRVLRALKSACPFGAAEPDVDPEAKRSCAAWNQGALEEIGRREEISVLLTSASAFNPFTRREGDPDWQTSGSHGYLERWGELPDHVERVVVLRDLPRPIPDVVRCLERRSPAERLEPGACARPRKKALLRDPLVLAARQAGPRVELFDESDVFCDAEVCSPIVGHALVYRDKSHMTATFARSLAPRLEAQLFAEPRAPER